MADSDHSAPAADGAGFDEDPEDLEPPEDEGVLDPQDTLEGDDLGADPLDTGISPRERRPASEGFGVTRAEAREGESLDQRLAEEEPDIPGVVPDSEPEPRAGRLLAEDEGAHPVGEAQPRQFADDVGRDGGAASAEEAAVHLVPDEDRTVAIPDENRSMVFPDDVEHVVVPDDERPVGQSDQADEGVEE